VVRREVDLAAVAVGAHHLRRLRHGARVEVLQHALLLGGELGDLEVAVGVERLHAHLRLLLERGEAHL
jgi:hypothetical protein